MNDCGISINEKDTKIEQVKPLYTPLTSIVLQIKPGSGLYTAMEFHSL